MDDLSPLLESQHIGLSYGVGKVNHLMYADDIVLFSPSVNGLQKLIDICKCYGDQHDIPFNVKKTVSMVINSVRKNVTFKPSFYLGDTLISKGQVSWSYY
jgi:hypothetical protein